MQRVEYRILYHDGRETRGHVDLPAADTEWLPTPSENAKKRWQMVRDIVQGVIGADAYPEHVRVWFDDQYLDMFVDETGVNKGLPRNAIATTIYRANVLAHEPPGSVVPEDLPIIAGDAVLFLDKVWS